MGEITPYPQYFMLKTLWIMGKIAPEEQFYPLSTIFYYLMLTFYVKTGIRFSLPDKRLFEITEVEITRVDCTFTILITINDGSPAPQWNVSMTTVRATGRPFAHIVLVSVFL